MPKDTNSTTPVTAAQQTTHSSAGAEHANAAAAQAAPSQAAAELILPLSIVSKSDISRALRDIIKLDDYFHQAAVRGSKDQPLPNVSRVLEGIAIANNLNLLHGNDRTRLREFLTKLKTHAPVVHMSFPSEASSQFLAKLLEWFRREAHPYTVIRVGLQPELAAGCLVRTTNKSFDFSFRKRFEKSKQKLIEALEAAGKEEAAKAAAEVSAAAQEASVPAAAEPVASAPVTEGTQ